MTDYNKTQFVKSAAKLGQLPKDDGIEVAFIGRSNAGKSRAINAITGHKSLARVSKTPGRTQLINVFAIEPHQRLIDLPGYGYAKVSTATRDAWAELINAYLQKRGSLHGLVQVMDIRHPLKASDHQLLQWTEQNHIPVHILLTKADKLRYGARQNTLLSVQKQLKTYSHEVSVQLFSSLDNWGLTEAQDQLDGWYEHNRPNQTV